MEFIGKVVSVYPTVEQATIHFVFDNTHTSFQIPLGDFNIGDEVSILLTKVIIPTTLDPCGGCGQSVSEQMQGELEPLPGETWDGGNIEVLKHGRE